MKLTSPSRVTEKCKWCRKPESWFEAWALQQHAMQLFLDSCSLGRDHAATLQPSKKVIHAVLSAEMKHGSEQSLGAGVSWDFPSASFHGRRPERRSTPQPLLATQSVSESSLTFITSS